MDFSAFRQMQSGHKLMVGNASCVACPRLLQVQLLALQLIARDVAFQHGALLPAGFHVSNDFLGQFQILLQHTDLVVQLIDIQVMPHEQEAYLLHILPQVEFCQKFP